MSEFISDEEMVALEAAQPKIEGFVSDADMVALEEANKTGVIEAGLRGAAQGITFGFADEITAAAESVFTDKTYDEAVEESRAAYEKAYEDQTTAYNIGDYGATVATMLAGPASALIKGGAKLGAKYSTKLGEKMLKDYLLKNSQSFYNAGTKTARAGATQFATRIGAAALSGGKTEVVKGVSDIGKALIKKITPKAIKKAVMKLPAKIVLNAGKPAGAAAGAVVGTGIPNVIGRSE